MDVSLGCVMWRTILCRKRVLLFISLFNCFVALFSFLFSPFLKYSFILFSLLFTLLFFLFWCFVTVFIYAFFSPFLLFPSICAIVLVCYIILAIII